MRAAVLAGLFLAGFLLPQEAFAATPEERYQAALYTLVRHCDQSCGFGINGTPEERAALDTLWDATEDWTISYLDTHPTASLAAINRELRRRHKQDATNIASDSAAVLAPGLYGFTASWDWTGHVFAVAKRDGHFAVVWDIRTANIESASILKAWRSDNARKDCEAEPANWQDDCGPIIANGFNLLPADGHGYARFALLATYGQQAETTVGGQLSIWTWDGASVRLSWAKPYTYNFEDVSWRRDGNLLKIRTTDWWHTIFSCGTCIGRQMNWTLHVRPDGIDDLGTKPVVPELDAFDELAWRIFKHENTDALANAVVRRRLATVIRKVQEQGEEFRKKAKDTSFDPNWFSFGMFGYKVRTVGGERVLDVNADELEFLGYSLRITFQRRGERLFATSISQVPIVSGEKPAAAIP